MSASADSSRERYAAVVKVLLREPDVTQSNKKGFGSTALWTNGKIFALLSSKDEFVVKLSRLRVDAQIGRASCRERVWISVVAVSVQKKTGRNRQGIRR